MIKDGNFIHAALQLSIAAEKLKSLPIFGIDDLFNKFNPNEP
jgi:hypothetical protein